MWSTNKKDRMLRSTLLIINCVANVAVVYIYLAYTGNERMIDVGIPSRKFFAEKMIDDECVPVCESRACISHANTLLSYMDSTTHPCDNVHSFLCGRFKEKFSFEEKAEAILENITPMLNSLKVVLDNIQAHPGSASTKMKIVYDSCVDYGSSELQGVIDFKNFLNSVGFFNWPNLSRDFNFSYMNFPVVLGKVMANGAKEYGMFTFVPASENDTDTDNLNLSFDPYLFNFDTEIHREAIISILKYFDLPASDMEAILNDYQLVKETILNLTKNSETCEDDCYDVFHIDCSNDNYDWRNLCDVVKEFLKTMNLEDQDILKSFQVKKINVNFYKNLFPFLNSISHRSVANFIVLNFIKIYQDELNFYLRHSKLKFQHFNEVEKGIEMLYYQTDRWKYCVRWIAKNMKLALTNEVFHQYFTHAVNKEITDIFNDCSSDLYDMVAHQNWIPSEVKTKAQNKIKEIIFIEDMLSQGFPNDMLVDKIYEKFQPALGSFFNNSLQLKKFANMRLIPKKYVNKQVMIAVWKNFEIQASALDPHLLIAYGMLLPPYYTPGLKKLMNRMTLGSIIGHELGHIFLDILHEPPEIPELLEKTRCVQDQFSRFKFEISNENLDGTKYDGENMPDNVGTALMDKITEKYYSTKEEIILPGLPYTMKQLLYMSASQMWCSKINLEEEMRHKLYNGSGMHSPQEFRVIAAMQNSYGYSKAFHCPDGSFMNPADKCTLLELH